MRFGKYIRDAVPLQWIGKEIQYKDLKKLIKRIQKLEAKEGNEADEESVESINNAVQQFYNALGEFVTFLQSELERVKDFLSTLLQDYNNKLSELKISVQSYFLMGAGKRKELEKGFISFYKEIDQLRNFRLLNVLALHKIVKKFKNVVKYDIEDTLNDIVNDEFFFKYDANLRDLQTSVEEYFTTTFEQHNFKNALNRLRRWSKRRSHWSSFLIGVPFGICVAFTICIIAMLFSPGLILQDVTNFFRHLVVFRMVGLFLIAIMCWGCNVFVWHRNRINYIYIFNYDKSTTMDYWKIFQIGLTLSCIYLFCLCGYIALSKELVFASYAYLAPAFPILLLAAIIGFITSPFNFLGTMSARIFWVKVLFRIFIGVFIGIKFDMFYHANLLTSWVKPLSDIPAIMCYYASGELLLNQNLGSCRHINLFTHFVFTIFPYTIRATQCLRLYYDTRKKFPHLVNSSKYMCSCVYIVLSHIKSVLKEIDSEGYIYFCVNVLWIVMLCFITCFSFTWDITVSFGLGRPSLKRPFLRKDLAYASIWYYYVAIVADFFMRLCWVVTITPVNAIFNEGYMIFFTSAVEILRRSIWSFFRLELEYVYDVDGFRSQNYIPDLMPLKMDDEL